MAIDLTRTYPVDRETTRRRVRALADDLARDYNLTLRWRDADRVDIKGLGVRGYLALEPHQLRLHLQTSLFLPVSESWLRRRVEEQLDRYLSA